MWVIFFFLVFLFLFMMGVVKWVILFCLVIFCSNVWNSLFNWFIVGRFLLFVILFKVELWLGNWVFISDCWICLCVLLVIWWVVLKSLVYLFKCFCRWSLSFVSIFLFVLKVFFSCLLCVFCVVILFLIWLSKVCCWFLVCWNLVICDCCFEWLWVVLFWIWLRSFVSVLVCVFVLDCIGENESFDFIIVVRVI